ncbi:hypothetical protein Thiowin_01639 [Thiorhodovibrio winogradskyi]|uniref:Uncharacterized protein n=1 Tax=Thiorhodovibrio winogradskyi TaxID=77007 RepID=A0ABZ0S827_9GAMM
MRRTLSAGEDAQAACSANSMPEAKVGIGTEIFQVPKLRNGDSGDIPHFFLLAVRSRITHCRNRQHCSLRTPSDCGYGVEQQRFAKATWAGEKGILALRDQPKSMGGLVHIIMTLLANLTEGRDADGEFLRLHGAIIALERVMIGKTSTPIDARLLPDRSQLAPSFLTRQFGAELA